MSYVHWAGPPCPGTWIGTWPSMLGCFCEGGLDESGGEMVEVGKQGAAGGRRVGVGCTLRTPTLHLHDVHLPQGEADGAPVKVSGPFSGGRNSLVDGCALGPGWPPGQGSVRRMTARVRRKPDLLPNGNQAGSRFGPSLRAPQRHCPYC